MTRQQLEEGGDAGRRRVLLDVRELAREDPGDATAAVGDTSSSSAERGLTAVAAFGAERVAVLQYSSPRDPEGGKSGSFARLGIFKNDNAHSAAPTAAKSAPSAWVSLWTKEENDTAQKHFAKMTAGDQEDDGEEEEPKWSLAWSPDGKYLVVSGVVVNQKGEREASLWVYSSCEWMALEDASKALELNAATPQPPLLIRTSPAKYLGAKELLKTSQVVSVFFQKAKSNRFFHVTTDGLLVKMDVQVPKLALLTLNKKEEKISEADKKALFTMKVVKRMSDWHAGVAAASFEASSGTLVVTGGLKNPSDELVRGRASSLSVWKMLEIEPFCDLLDYTMVLSEDHAMLDSAPVDGEPTTSAIESNDAIQAAAANNSSSSGLLQSVKGSIFSPLKFMIGGGEADSSVLQCSIHQLAISPNGVYVTMLDNQRRFLIRQIDTCSDVVNWQFVDTLSSTGRVSVADMLEQVDGASASVTVKSVSWVSADLLAFVLENGRVMYGELKREFDDNRASDVMQSEEARRVSTVAAALGIIEMVPVQSHVRSFPALLEKDLRIDAVAPISTGEGVKGYQLVTVNGVSTVNYFENVGFAAFVDLLMESHQYDRALDVVESHGMTGVINLDAIHRQIWNQFRNLATVETAIENHQQQPHTLLATERVCPGNGFSKALHHLSLIQVKKWVVDECLNVIASDSFDHMKEILGAGLHALMGSSEIVGDDDHEDSNSVKQQKLLRFIYRLDTLKLLLVEDLLETDETLATFDGDAEDPTRLAERYYDGAVFAQFRNAPIVEVAKQLACEGRVRSLTILFQRNAWTIIPRRLEVLSLLPASIAPVAYAHLLPAVGPDSRDEWQFYTLRPQANTQEDFEDDNLEQETRVVEVVFNAENKSHDLNAEDLALFESKARQSDQERHEEYATWFQARMLEMDALFGQLANAFQLSSLAKECLRGWQDGGGESSSQKKIDFEGFQQDVKRLYNCVYPLQLSSCCLLSLQEWSTLSLHDQILCVIGEWESVTDAIDRIQAVFVAQRGNALCTLDDAFSTLCQTLSKKSSIPTLELCAQLIHHSNPSMPIVERWIQNDAQLLRTSIDVVYSATASGYFASAEALNAQHTTFVEQLWMIFQSLPVRKENDLPEIEQLQVEVDEMEDLMVTMDVLSKYGVHSSPSELKMQIGEASSTAADDLLQRMCRFSLPGNESSSDNSNDDAQQWMEVWRDATKLKTHVFGERISQEAILDVILRHLLSYDVYLDAAEHLVTNWISGNYEVIHHVIVVLTRAIQAKIDTLKGNFVSESDLKIHFAALKCIDITNRVLTFPSLERELDRKKYYERQLRHEKELVHACQLLDLLTYGAVKLSPVAIRPLKDAKDRLDVVLKVFTSNPSHYQPSNRAKEWFRQHNLGQVLHSSDSATSPANATPLEAVLYLAKLLRVEDHKHQIVMKGAYAALYCADYDVAYGLTTEVIQSIHVGKSHHHNHHSDDVELQHLMSLVLDLISASSFRSWSKKLKLCRLIFSAQNVSSTSMFSHQIMNLIMSSMEKLEAIETLATEMGLSEGDVEERRHQDTSKRSSVEELLLKELEIVVDLLQEEKNDRGFLLRLLQKGFQLVYIVLTGAITQQADDNDENDGSAHDEAVVKEEMQRVERMVQHMSRICFQEAIVAASESKGEVASLDSVTKSWRAYLEMGCSYLLLWSDFATGEECDLEVFWEEEILPLLFAALSSGSQEMDLLIRQFHHFFMLQVASAVQGDGGDEADESAGVAYELHERRKQLEVFAGSYDETKRFVVSKNFEPEAEGDDELLEETSDSRSKAAFSKAKRDIFARLAKRCQEMILSQKKSQELEEMNSFFNENLDLERFSRDAEYRVSKILMLATKKEHYQVAKQFATKYGVDEYQCLLSYIKSVFLPVHTGLSSSSVSTLNRHEQLEIAFRGENEDFLEQALEKPFVFGHFLLNNDGESVYESLDGTDHMGILLLLRMVLECSKRISQLPSEELKQRRVNGSLFPLSKASSDRITLLFMCLKRLKEVEPVRRGSHQTEVVDFKLVCAADSCTDLLNPLSSSSSASNASESRKIAIEALLPFLNGKTIKMLTKILQKLHHVTTSAVVMVYLSDMLQQIWLDQRGQSRTSELSADLAVYAYEACTPFLSVLSNEHVMLFHCLFMGRNWESVVANVSFEDEFYGQSMNGFKHFGALLTTEKRMELISDTLTLFQTRFEAWKAAAQGSNGLAGGQDTDALLAAKEKELRFLERELIEAAFWFIVDEVKTKQILFPAAGQSSNNNWRHWEAMMENWFSKETDVEKDAGQQKQEIFGLLVQLCQMVSSVEIASLIVELVLLLAPPSNKPVEATLEQVYRRVFSSMVDANVSNDRLESVQRSIVSEWAMLFPDVHSSVREQYSDGAGFTDTLCPLPGRASIKPSLGTYQRILTRLNQFPSTELKEMVEPKMAREASVRDVEPPMNAAHAAVIAEWCHLSDAWDQEQNWTQSAVLTRLVLDSGATRAMISEELRMHEREYFGLQTKAIFDLLRGQNEFEAAVGNFDVVFSIPTGLLYERFDSVFKSALTVLSASKEQGQGLQSLTMALANLLHFYDSVSSKHQQQNSLHTWKKEQSEVLKRRIQVQFGISGGVEESESTGNGSTDNANSEDNWWSQLLLHGHWSGDRALMKWYLEMGYAKITTPRVIEAFAVAHWEAKKHVCVELILLSPFEKLHAHHRNRLVQSGCGGFVGGRRVVELLLLRFDVQVLLQAGLYQSLLNLHLNEEEGTEQQQQLWTSSGEYLVCALVVMKEYATAARLACALWHAHPLLWDFENARLTLANYLKSLATAQLPELSLAGDEDGEQSSAAMYDEAILRHQVYGRTFNFFQRNMTM